MAKKKILMLVGDFVEDYETMVPFQILSMVGHEVHAVCPGKASGETIKTAIHDFEGDQTYSEKRGHNFALNAGFDEVNPAVKTDVELAGGSWVPNNDTFSNAHTDGKLVSAPAWPAHPEWMKQFLQVLGSKIEP